MSVNSDRPVDSAPVVATYDVIGMTCDHCVQAVAGELRKLDGVTNVSVDLATGTATVGSDTALNPSEVAAAIDEAGYELAP